MPQSTKSETSPLRLWEGKGPKISAASRTDQVIREDICDDLLNHPDIDATEVEVTVVNREVTLTGNIETRVMKRLAGNVSEAVYGVTALHNRLRVKVPRRITPSPLRGYGEAA